MQRSKYFWFALFALVLVSGLYAAQEFIPDPAADGAVPQATAADSATRATAGDTTTAPGAIAEPAGPSVRSEPSGWPLQDEVTVGALVLAGLGLALAGGALWALVTTPAGGGASARPSDPVQELQADAAASVAAAAARCVRAGTQWAQLVQMQAQLGDEAPAELPDHVAQARGTLQEHHQALQAALTSGAVWLPNGVLQAGRDVDETVRLLQSDVSAVAMQGTALAAQVMVAYYTYAAAVRRWTGVEPLDVERLVGAPASDAEADDAGPESDGAEDEGRTEEDGTTGGKDVGAS